MEAWKTDMKHFLIRSGESFFGKNAIVSSIKWHSENGFAVIYIVKESCMNEKLNVLFEGTRSKIKQIHDVSEADLSIGAINMIVLQKGASEQTFTAVIKAMANVKNCFFGFDEVNIPDILLMSDEIGEIAYSRYNRIGIKYPFDSLPKIAHQVNFEVVSPLK